MDTIFCDVLVIGSGAAGLRASISAAGGNRRIVVVSKGAPGMATCTLLSGAAFRGVQDSADPSEHRELTLQAGRGINDRRLLEVLIQDAPGRIRELEEWGIRGVVQGPFLVAEGRAPVWGEEVIRCLLGKARALGVVFHGSIEVQRIVPAGSGFGVLAHTAGVGGWVVFICRAVVLATGGAGALYLRHDNPQRMLGDGYGLALEAGARLQDMEFVQFYPLGLAEPGLPSHLVPPRLADRGRLVNDEGEEILSKYSVHERPAGEKARDRLSQALFREVYREGRTVWMDLRDALRQDWSNDLFSLSGGRLLKERCGAGERALRVAPVAHFTMGGVRIETTGATSVPGLFAAGEAVGGLHGANRLGGNALTETLVFGARAGEAAAMWVEGGEGARRDETMARLRETIPTSSQTSARIDAIQRKRKLRETLWQEGGILKSQHGLARATGVVEEILDHARRIPLPEDRRQASELLDLRLAARIARIILEASLRREESRGAHFREDFPETDDARWLGHLTVSSPQEGEEVWAFEPMLPDTPAMAS